jgi:hypothetical protein
MRFWTSFEEDNGGGAVCVAPKVERRGAGRAKVERRSFVGLSDSRNEHCADEAHSSEPQLLMFPGASCVSLGGRPGRRSFVRH